MPRQDDVFSTHQCIRWRVWFLLLAGSHFIRRLERLRIFYYIHQRYFLIRKNYVLYKKCLCLHTFDKKISFEKKNLKYFFELRLCPVIMKSISWSYLSCEQGKWRLCTTDRCILVFSCNRNKGGENGYFRRLTGLIKQINTHKNNAGSSWRYQVSCGRIRSTKGRERKIPFGAYRLIWVHCDRAKLKGASCLYGQQSAHCYSAGSFVFRTSEW